MSFSVLMSLYAKERPDYLRQSLDSVFNQTLPPDEVVLVEDGPLTTELEAVVNDYSYKYPTLKIIKLEKNQGLGRALNEGLKHCVHPIVARMDTDDIAMPNRFERQLAVFEAYPETDVVSCWINEFVDDISNVVSVRKLPEYQFELFEYGKKRCPINHPAVTFKKSAVLFAGGYRHFMLFEDYYLWVRLLLNGAKFYNVQESLLYFRASPDMYKRRGGLKHALTEVQFQREIKNLGYIHLGRMIMNILIRFSIRILPNSIRTLIYIKILRNV